jgi:iron only hydrogenase large subunit-like protein
MKNTLRDVIKVIEDKCVNCHRCISVCPVKFCNDGSGNTVIVRSDLCIGCGKCISACTHEARIGIDDTDLFFNDLKNGEKIIAVVAPAVASNFENLYLNLNGWLKKIGVDAFFDVSFGAELTVKSYIEYKKQNNPKTIIAQPCPAIVNFIELYRPKLLNYLAPADSPMVHTMKMIKAYYPRFKNHKIAVLSPCLAKRREFDYTGYGEYNVTFKALKNYIEENTIDLNKYPSLEYDNPPAERAVLFSSPGGLVRTAERDFPGITEKTRKIEGSPHIYHYLENMDEAIMKGKSPVYELVDCLNCEMGCNG